MALKINGNLSSTIRLKMYTYKYLRYHKGHEKKHNYMVWVMTLIQELH